MVRTAYKKKYPQKRCSGKVDITSTEYYRFLEALIKELHFFEIEQNNEQ